MGSMASTTAAENESPTEVRVLLWSPRGSGEHYHGPASFTHRLYSSVPAGRLAVTLAHGLPSHERYALFRRQHFIASTSSGPFGQWRFIRRGCRWIDEHAREFDVLHGITAFHRAAIPAVHAQRLGLPGVLFIANHDSELSDKPGLKGLLGLPRKRRELIKELSGFVAMSAAIHDELAGYGIAERKIARIPMGVNTKVYHPAENGFSRSVQRKDLGWLDIPTVAFVGAITPRKRPHLLIEALGLLKRNGLECQLALVGPAHDTAYAMSMKARAEDLQIDGQVIWVGFTRDVARLMRSADFFCLPSENEGMAASLIEAMASGLAPIVTPVSGSVDVVREGINGRLVRGDAAEIADALAQYLRDPSMGNAHGEMARADVLSKYSMEAVAAEYESLFRRLIAGGDANPR
jgi:glycosyltransferase involved in cell wall biosynthesis